MKKKEDLKIIPIKTTRTERRALKSRAQDFANGNLSAWLRHAGLNYRPKKAEQIG